MVKESTFAVFLHNIIRKVSRYKEAARLLYRIAKKFPLVRNIELHVANLPKEVFDRPHHPEYSPILSVVLCRLGKIDGKQYDVSQISRFLRIIQEAKIHAKIHAKIQLIAYCEIQDIPLFPRAIASSKDACFLCHAFIRSQGKMYISHSHGRLYPGWQLPMLLSFKMLEPRFNEVLLNYARQTVKTRHKGQVDARPYPNVSTLLPMLASASTMSSVHGSVRNNTERTTSVPSVSPGPGIMKFAVSDAGLLERKYLSVGSELLRCCVQTPSDPSTGTVNPTASSLFFSAGRLHLYFEIENSTLELAAQSRTYSNEIMTVDQTTMLSVGSLIVDVTKLEREMTYRLPADGTFCLIAHGDTVKIVCKR
ncbi:hypothetical protein NUU61_001330 [Penicillium alfredii]|uniref:Uncharacterized protein n=1 Tax=Penicillium alfredii TaxID=1506179 RepID=A0A9W9G3W5_9EURO|nr:uncharacterized protein NUU61_001330 [Penicillium alfredii]KAJ5111700.1 hypothetical protein NUU61_001330 [Penicillium alfredii]